MNRKDLDLKLKELVLILLDLRNNNYSLHFSDHIMDKGSKGFFRHHKNLLKYRGVTVKKDKTTSYRSISALIK